MRVFFCLALSLIPNIALAEYEGVLDYQMSSPGGTGNMKMYLSKAGMRTEMSMGQMRMVMLHLFAKKGFVYHLDEASKTYRESDLSKQQAPPSKANDEKYEVKKLGEETIAGLKATHGVIKDSRGNETEIWVSNAIAPPADVRRAFANNPRAGDSMFKALDEAGMIGMMVKLVPKKGEGKMELVKYEKKKLDAALFSLTGYTKGAESSGAGMPPGMQNLPPDVQRQIKEQMEKAAREQREQE